MRVLPEVACVLVVALGSSLASAGEPALQSQVVFGTTCARCHEAECSGRLTFDTGAMGAANHIRRHADALPDGALLELFQLLERMKRECAYLPLRVPLPRDGVWSAEALSKLCVPSRHDYLVPLGTLEPGEYLVEFRIPDEQHIHVEVLTRDFEPLLEEPLVVLDGKATITFTARKARGPHESLLRLHGQEPILLEQVVIRRQPRSRGRGGAPPELVDP